MKFIKHLYYDFLNELWTGILWKIRGIDGIIFGHDAYLDSNCIWRWSDTNEIIPMKDNMVDILHLSRTCPKCKLLPTIEGHDPCIANLSGVKYACCGHGREFGYITEENGKVIRFRKVPNKYQTIKTTK